MDVALLVFLILLNGAFAMAEMGLTAARKARLQVMVETGDRGAEAAMKLHEDPTRWLSTVQIGITSIGLLNGIVGEAAFAGPLGDWLELTFGLRERPADIAATAGVVVLITFCTIIFGELVPKRIGQMFPEPVARFVARPMNLISTATKPFVWMLSASNRWRWVSRVGESMVFVCGLRRRSCCGAATRVPRRGSIADGPVPTLVRGGRCRGVCTESSG